MNQFNSPMPEGFRKPSPVLVKRAVKKCYNRGCAALLFQFLIANVISVIATVVYSAALTVRIMAENENLSDSELTQKVTEAMNPAFIIGITAVAYLVANLISSLIGNASTSKFYRAKSFRKIQFSAADCGLCILSIIGLQGISLILQIIVTTVTGYTGIDSETASAFSFSDNIAQNILLILYTVIIAAITEEILCRGVVMKLLSPVSSRFALVASALMFGLMHGNFNQIFNGFLLGLVLGYSALKGKSILISIICHMAANAHAMLLSFLEYKIGKDFFIPEIIYMAVISIVGVFAVYMLLRRNGRIDPKADRLPETVIIPTEECEQGGMKWKLLLTAPCFWIFTAIYLITAIIMVSPVA